MVRKVIRFISGLAIFAIVCFVVWFALVNYNVIDNPYETKAELISLSQSEIRLKRKNTYQLSASLVPSNVRNGIVSYSSSNPNVATVNEASGFIYAVSNGTTTITATLKSNKNIKADCTVIVSDNDVTINRIELNTKTININVGGTYPITYKLTPRNATLHSIEYYSSDEKIVKVDNSGKVEGLKEGRAIVTVSDKVTGIKETIDVNVSDKNQVIDDNNTEVSVNAPKSISINPKLISLNIGGSRKLEVTITPDKTNKKVTWRSLNSDVATVSSDGLVVGKKEGSTKIVATTVNGIDAYVNVDVVDNIVNVKKIEVSPSNMNLNVGDKKEFNYTITPENATNQGVMISSSDDNVISISDNNVVAIKEGTADVTITTVDGDYSATIKVTVSGKKNIVNETDLTVSPTVLNLSVGSSFEINAKVSPNNATYKTVSWSSANENVATVNNGLVVGVSKGKTEIIVSTTNKKITKKVTVNVTDIDITNITLDKSNESIKVGETLSLIKTITPSNASNQNVSWDSSNTNVATVDSNGLVTGKNAGKTTITVRTSNGKMASCMVEVK